jgi:hypothetical protein
MKTKTAKNPGLIYAKALDRHNQIEQRLSRLMNAWQKSRAALRRLEKKLDEAAMDEAQARVFDESQAFIDDPL